MSQDDKIKSKNEKTLRQLAFSIASSQGQFKLILVRCNYANWRSQILKELQDLCEQEYQIKLPVLELNAEDTTLYTRIKNFIGTSQLQGLQIIGWENVTDLDTLLKTANQIRESLREEFSFPLLLWIDDSVLIRLMDVANDLYSWSTSKRFIAPVSVLLDDLELKANQFFERILTTDDTHLLGVVPLFSAQEQQETATALEELQKRGESLSESLQASIDFVEGRNAYRQSNWEDALNYYSKSLEFWQSKCTEIVTVTCQRRAGVVLLHQGLAHLKLAEEAEEKETEYSIAQEKFEQSLQAFEMANQPQLVKRFQNCVAVNLLSIYLQAQQQVEQEKSKEAIANLEKLRQIGAYGFPHLYLRGLKLLQKLYFEQEEDYLEAFKIHQQCLAVERSYGLRAFVGAGYLQPLRDGVLSLSTLSHATSLPPEIEQSGRGDNVRELVERIGRSDYKLIIIHGYSGVGKSSLIKAGLVPALQHQLFQGRDVIPVVVRVYQKWIEELGKALQEAIPPNWFAGEEIAISEVNTIEAIKEILKQSEHKNCQIVIIFDQFEEFFFVNNTMAERRQFFNFLGETIAEAKTLSSVKVVLSLRKDYLHYLLECNQLKSMEIISQDILSKNILYPLGNLTVERTKALINKLTANTSALEEDLVDQLVEDLKDDAGEIRPIELQIVGTQLETEKIQTLAEYQQLGEKPKEELVKKYLQEVIDACGSANKQMANLVLYSLTDERGTRPLRSQADLMQELKIFLPKSSQAEEKLQEQLKLILDIFVLSGLVVLVPTSPVDQYQLVHDYLAMFIRISRESELKKIQAEYEKEKQQRLAKEKELEQAEQKNQKANEELEQAKKKNRRATLLSTLLGVAVLPSSILASYKWAEFTEAKNNLQKTKEEAREQLEKAEYEAKKAKEAEYQAKKAEQAKKEAEEKVKKANADAKKVIDLSNVKVEKANINLQEAEQKAEDALEIQKQAEIEREKALAQTEQARINTQRAIENMEEAQKLSRQAELALSEAIAETILARTGTKLERLGVTALKMFSFNQLEALVKATEAGKELQQLVKGKSLQNYPALSPLFSLQQILANIRERNRFEDHQGYVLGVAFSPDGKTIASASWDRTVRLWNLKGNQLAQFERHTSDVNSVAFSPDGKMIASGSSDKTVRLWDLQGNQLPSFEGHQSAVNSVAFSPDGQMIASASGSFLFGGNDKTVRLWDLQGNQLPPFEGHQSDVNSVAFSPDGKMIASGSSDKTVRLWDLQGNQLPPFEGHQSDVNSVAFSPDGLTIASGSSDKTVRLWDLQGNQLPPFEGHQSSVLSVAFSPDGKTIASGSRDKTVRLWDLQGNELAQFKGHQNWVRSVIFSPDGKMIASGSMDKTVRLWDLQGNQLPSFEGHRDYVESIAFSPDGKTIVSGSVDGTVCLWNLKGNQMPLCKGHGDSVESIAFSPDGKTIASGSDNGTVRLWNLEENKLTQFKAHQSPVYSVAFSPDGKTIASASGSFRSGSNDNTVRLWDLKGNQLAQFEGHQSPVLSVAFSPDGKTIASVSGSFRSGGNDNTVRLWDLKGNQLAQFEGHQSPVLSVAFNPDGKTIASASADNTVRLWDLKGNQLAQFEGHQDFVESVAFSPDGQMIASGSRDKTVHLWDLKGNQLAQFEGHQSAISSVAFSPDGKTITSGSWDRTVRLWQVENLDQLLDRACDWLHDYLLTNPNVTDEQREMCGIGNK